MAIKDGNIAFVLNRMPTDHVNHLIPMNHIIYIFYLTLADSQGDLKIYKKFLG